MICLTHFKGKKFYLNADKIISVESVPDTVIKLDNDEKVLVAESAEVVIEKIIKYRRMVENPELEVRIGE